MTSGSFAAWLDAVRAADDDLYASPPPPPALTSADVPGLVDALASHIERLRVAAHYDFSPTLALLLEALLASGQRRWFQPHEVALVRALSTWVDNAEHGPDCLVALMWLNTSASVACAAEHVASNFTRRETEGHGRVVDAVVRTTEHVDELFPRLAQPLETQQVRALVWDRWHVSTATAIARLANDLHRAGRVTPHPLAAIAAELTMLLEGGERCCTKLEAREKRTFKAALGRVHG